MALFSIIGRNFFTTPVEDKLKASVNHTITMIESTFQNFAKMQQSFENLEFLQNRSKKDFVKFVVSLNKKYPQIVASYIGYESDGLLFYTTDEGYFDVDIDPRTRPWYEDVKRTNKTVVTDFYEDAVTQSLTVTIASPIYDSNNNLLAVLGFDIYINEFINMLQKEMKQNISDVIIYDFNNKILFSSIPSLQNQDNPPLINDFTQAQQTKLVLPKSLYINHTKENPNSSPAKKTYQFYNSVTKSNYLRLSFVSLLHMQYLRTVFNKILYIFIFLSIVVLIISSIVNIIVSNRLLNPLHNLAGHMKNVSDEGKLKQFNSDAINSIELENLVNSFNYLIKNFEEVILGINKHASEMQTVVKENNYITNVLSNFSTNEATTIEEISSILEESITSLSQLADNVKETNQIILKGNKKAEKGGELLNQIITNMEDINQHSHKIKSSIELINDLTEQTNLLSLNASIEAARAGEAGKGFNVVATEIRKLAEKSGSTSEEIQNRIKQNDQSVLIATNLVDKSRNTFQDIIDQVIETSKVIDEISSSVSEQTQGSQEIMVSIDEMNNGVQKIVNISDNIKNIAEMLDKESKNLEKLAKKFIVEDKPK